MDCLHCGAPTANPKFCSRSCAATHTNKESPKRPLGGVCRGCGAAIPSRLKQCRTCRDKNGLRTTRLDRPLSEFRIKNEAQGHSPAWLHSQVRQVCRTLHKGLLGKPCAVCGYAKHVELAHIKPLVSFPDEALLSVVNAKENVIQLCPNCHWELDHGEISLPGRS